MSAVQPLEYYALIKAYDNIMSPKEHKQNVLDISYYHNNNNCKHCTLRLQNLGGTNFSEFSE